jgi:hypothetical protein
MPFKPRLELLCSVETAAICWLLASVCIGEAVAVVVRYRKITLAILIWRVLFWSASCNTG